MLRSGDVQRIRDRYPSIYVCAIEAAAREQKFRASRRRVTVTACARGFRAGNQTRRRSLTTTVPAVDVSPRRNNACQVAEHRRGEEETCPAKSNTHTSCRANEVDARTGARGTHEFSPLPARAFYPLFIGRQGGFYS